jgi:hypothetical protein
MISIEQFVQQTQGQRWDNGWGGYLGECVSLIWRLARDVQDVPLGVLYCSKTEGARDLYEQFDRRIPEFYNRVEPQDLRSGDIAVWGDYMGKWGHVSYVLSRNGNTFESYEQNSPVGSRANTRTHTLAGVIGGLRLKTAEQPGRGAGEEMITATEEEVRHAFSRYSDKPPTDDQVRAYMQQDHAALYNDLAGYMLGRTQVSEGEVRDAFIRTGDKPPSPKQVQDYSGSPYGRITMLNDLNDYNNSEKIRLLSGEKLQAVKQKIAEASQLLN